MLERMKEINHIEGFSSFIVAVIAAPILEELIYRGIVLEGLLKKYSPIFAILFSAFLFAIAHLNPWQFVVGMVMGIFNGWIYFKVRNLLYPILAHMSCNLVNTIIRYSHQINTTDAVLPKPHPIEIFKLIPGLIFFNLITLLFLYLLNNAFKKEYQSSIKENNLQ
jgi:membrane protease YdiL (CAAX protease family)